MSSIPMHASCHGNRSGEAFLKDPVKHLECAWLGERVSEREREERERNRCVVDGRQLFIFSSFFPPF